MNDDALIKKICKIHGARFHDMSQWEDDQRSDFVHSRLGRRRYYEDRHTKKITDVCINYGGALKYTKEIWIGPYASREKRLATFFHELGHIVNRRIEYKSVYHEEVAAWGEGLNIALEHNVIFSRKTLRWCDKMLETYNHGNYPRNRIQHYVPQKSWFSRLKETFSQFITNLGAV